jgi:nitrite reductase/ring-hydroxylating ferredoxin subunit
MKTLLSSILLFVLLFASSCKDDNPYRIPYVFVNFNVYPTNIDSELGVNQFKYFPKEGYRGVLVYNNGFNQFLAYERACTFDTENPTAIVAVDASGLIAVCPVCKSKYIITDGYPYEGPAKNPLLPYSTTNEGSNVYVHN